MRHFARCVRGKEQPQSTGEDGRVVTRNYLRGLCFGRTRPKIALPYHPKGLRKPIDGWRGVGQAK